jgi:hypothetical protein
MAKRKAQASKRRAANDIRLGDKVFVKSQRLGKAKKGDVFEVIEIVTISIKNDATGRIRNLHASHVGHL